MSEPLKPCPFCGSKMTQGTNGLIFHPDEPWCEMRVPSPTFPLTRWQNRPGEEALQAEIDRLKLELASKEGFSDAPF